MAGIEYELRGANGLLFNSTEQEVMLAGGAETGKTVASILKLHAVCGSVAGAQGAIVRKTQASLAGSVVKTYLRIIQPQKRGIKIYGGEKPERFIYPNGSVIWLGGMDNPNKVLSSERDIIYVNQAEELSLDDWEILLTRATGRGAVVEHSQLFGDCNPSGSMHWIRKRKTLRLLNAHHRDNPSLYKITGEITEQGKKSLAALNNLTGIRRKRLLLGIWATAEGAVYEMFNAIVSGNISDHVQVRSRSDMQRFYLALDDGFTNPAVILDIGSDTDGRWHIFREFYKRGWIQDEVADEAKKWHKERPVELAAVDEAAAGLVEALNRKGVPSYPGKGRIFDGISKIQARLKVQNDGRPRLTIDPSCIETINEFESYVWKPEKDVPVDEYNHGLGALRYLADVLNEPTGAFESSSDLMAADQPAEIDELTLDDVGIE